MRITLLGHSTLLLETSGGNLLTDPFFSPRSVAGILVDTPAMTPAEAAEAADAVLVTHAHPDHCDPGFFRMLPACVPVLVPAGFRWPHGILRPAGTHELPPRASRRVAGACVHAVPARHMGACCGFVVEADDRIVYVAGDTYHGRFMEGIANRFRLDLAALPLRTVRVAPVMDPAQLDRAVTDLHPDAVLLLHRGIRMASGPGGWLGSALNLADSTAVAVEVLTTGHPGMRVLAPEAGGLIEV